MNFMCAMEKWYLTYFVILVIIFEHINADCSNKWHTWNIKTDSTQKGQRLVTAGDFYFENVTLKTQCAWKCLIDTACKSFSFSASNYTCVTHPKIRTDEGVKIVDGADWDTDLRDDYKIDQSALEPCNEDSCSKNGFCFIKLGGRSKFCACHLGYGGDSCEIKLDPPSWSEWSPWEKCSVHCGPGITKRNRTCQTDKIVDNLLCQGIAVEYNTCQIKECLGWGNWTDWGQCSTENTCGRGVRTRSRICLSDDATLDCLGPSEQEQFCQSVECNAPIRLAGTLQPREGWLNVYDYINKTWTQVCKDGWKFENTKLACKQLGYEMAEEEYPTTDSYEILKEPIVFTKFDCTSNDTKLMKCKHETLRLTKDCQRGPIHIRCQGCPNDTFIPLHTTPSYPENVTDNSTMDPLSTLSQKNCTISSQDSNSTMDPFSNSTLSKENCTISSQDSNVSLETQGTITGDESVVPTTLSNTDIKEDRNSEASKSSSDNDNG